MKPDNINKQLRHFTCFCFKMATEGADNSSVVRLQFAKISEIKEVKVKGKTKCMFVLEVQWANGLLLKIWRSYNDFFEFQCKLLDNFRDEAGCSKNSKRIIPFLPGKKIFTKNDMKLAEERRPLLEHYLQELLKLPARISQNVLFLSFFEKWVSDPHSFTNPPHQLSEKKLQSSFESLLDEDPELWMKQAYDNTSFDDL